jgi:general secretion pathway protein C
MLNRIAGHSRLLAIPNATMGALLLITILFFLRDIIITSVDKKGVKPAYSPRVETQRQERRSFQDYDIILRNNPFGFPAGQLKLLAAAVVDKTPPPSDMELIGTIAGPPAYSYAIFAAKDGKQEMFKRGESVFGAGILTKVEPYKVFIRQSNKLTEISMADVFMINEPAPRDGAGSPQFVKPIEKGEYVIDQKALQQALDNPNQIMTDARLFPHIVDNKQEGFVLREIKKNGIYDSLGLKNGDVLLRINNYNIANPENALQAFTALRGMDRVQLDIIRDGAKTTMTYQIR